MKYVLILIILAIFQVPLLIMHTMNPDLSLWFVLSPLWLSILIIIILAVWFAVKDKKEILKHHNYGKGIE